MKIWKRIRKKWHNDIFFSQNERQKELEEVVRQQAQELKEAVSWNNLEVIRLRDGMIRTTPRKTLKLAFDIVEKCNLNCAGCLVYAPLAGENSYVMSVETFEQDIARIHALFCEEEIEVIRLSGGEPLLHEKLAEFPKVIRKYFPKAGVRIVTNGMLLLKQPDKFWRMCRENNVILEQTKYPIRLDFEKIRQTAKENGVKHIFMDDTGECEKTMQIFPVQLSGGGIDGYEESQNVRLNFFHCWEANQCIRVCEGRVYTCSRIPHIKLLNEYFHMEFAVSEDDSLDLFSVNAKEDVYEFLAHAVPFCRYCKVHEISESHAWKVSALKIEEWAK